ncbi:MAG: cation diffusion facilitator family transporter [Polyangiales bacterium]
MADTVHAAERLARWSLVGGVAVLALKTVAWRATDSVALLSDALESTVNVAAAAVMFAAVRVARRPADRDHPYGHGKAEYLSAALEGLLIAVAAVLDVLAAVDRLRHPRALESVGVGLLVSVLATAINGALAWRLIVEGKRHRSPALAADGRHLVADVVTSAGVLVGVALAWVTRVWWLDPALACLVAVNILWMGWKLVRRSVGGLMDEVLDVDEVVEARAVATRAATEGGAVGVRGFRLRRAGAAGHCDLTLVVPGSMAVRDAHAIADRVEDALRGWDALLDVVVHVEPDEKR